MYSFFFFLEIILKIDGKMMTWMYPAARLVFEGVLVATQLQLQSC